MALTLPALFVNTFRELDYPSILSALEFHTTALFPITHMPECTLGLIKVWNKKTYYIL